jgi:acyl-coenzyme A thioesterase PaaI-like protein
MNGTPARQVSSGDLETPAWCERLRPTWGEEVVVAEWEQAETADYRAKNGWKGKDLVHDKDAAVHISQYYVKYGSATPGLVRGGTGTCLTGIVHFTERAESHRGYCHGGSMTCVMDDVIGWVGFMVTGECRPWSGFTVQINTSLQMPIPVHSTLLVVAEVTKLDRRKVFIEARIVDPADSSQHAKAEGIVVLNRGVLPEEMLQSQVSSVSME